MNFVYLSPHFPPNYYAFCVELRAMGANVLGLADEPYDFLHPALKSALGEYYRVDDMHNYDNLLRALGHFTHRHGKIDRLDSLNEYWLETEARLRTDFNIPGLRNEDMGPIKRKSLMKKNFVKAGVRVAQGAVVHNMAQAQKLIKDTGFPVVAKPDIGVGAAATYKIHSKKELEDFFRDKPAIDYIMEAFVNGTIMSFDGLTDREGNLVFYTAHQYSEGVMEAVNQDSLIYYYSLREIPEDLETAGRNALKVFDVRERFFHFEFFRDSQDGEITALEVNMRPPGGLTTDMFNFANDINIYREWANIIVNNRFEASYERPYHCSYIGRKSNRAYRYTHEQVVEALKDKLVFHGDISGVFSAALGNYGYLVRSSELDEIHEMAAFVHTLA